MCWFYESRNPICLHLVSCYIWLFPSFWFSTWLYICLFYACILLFSYKQKFFFPLISLVSIFLLIASASRTLWSDELCKVTNFVKWQTLWTWRTLWTLWILWTLWTLWTWRTLWTCELCELWTLWILWTWRT